MYVNQGGPSWAWSFDGRKLFVLFVFFVVTCAPLSHPRLSGVPYCSLCPAPSP